MKWIVLFLIILSTFSSAAQDCSKEVLRQKKGAWKAGVLGSVDNVTPGDLAKEKALLGAIHKILTAGYSPTGCQVSYSTVYGKQLSAAKNWISNPYHYAMYILPFVCDQKSADKSKFKAAIASATNVNITANVIFSLNNLYAANLPDDDFRGYLKLKQRPQKKEAAWFMGEEIVGDYGTNSEIKEYSWLITYNDTLPFLYLNRKEYLLIQKKRLEQSLKDNSGDKEYTNKFLNNINEYLKKPETDLRKDAVCKWNEEERFESFAEEGTRGSFIAVKPNLEYYHKKLPKSCPQFFTVVYTVSKGEPVFEDNIAAIKKVVDFSILKNMLGK